MPGWNNGVSFGQAFQITPSDAEDIDLAQRGSADNVSILNYSGNPEGLVSANPSSLSHDRTGGDIYYKQTGTGTTGWLQLNSGAIPDPTTTSFLFDDFLSGPTLSATLASRECTGNTNFFPILSGGASCRLGITSSGLEAVGEAFLQVGNDNDLVAMISSGQILMSQGLVTITFRVKLSFAAPSFLNFVIGFGRNVNSGEASFTDGVYFYFEAGLNSNNFIIKSVNTSVQTTANTTTGIDTDWHNYTIVIDNDAGSIDFLRDGVAVTGSPLIATIPTAGLNMVVLLNRTNNIASNFLYVDYIKFEQNLNFTR